MDIEDKKKNEGKSYYTTFVMYANKFKRRNCIDESDIPELCNDWY